MLAQNFKTAEDLDVTPKQHEALIKILGMLERGELVYHYGPGRHTIYEHYLIPNGFNMGTWSFNSPRTSIKCATVCCIGGWVEALTGQPLRCVSTGGDIPINENLRRLVYPEGVQIPWYRITVDEAAQALRNYLTRGEARWDEVIRRP